MVLKVDREFSILPKVEFKPKPKIEPAKTALPESNTRRIENNFLGNLVKEKLFAQFGTGSNPPLLASLTFDKDQQVTVGEHEPPVIQFDSSMSGTDAAKAILSQENPQYDIDAYETQTKFFIDAAKAHRNDPKWMEEFFKALGPDKMARLINDTLTPGVFQRSTPEEVRESLAAIRDTISNLASANPPLFDQSDMDALVKSMASDSRGFYDLIALELFGKMDYKSESVKNMFFKSASQLALSGQLNDKQSKFLAAAAAHVLSTTSANNQAEQLSALRGQTPAGLPSELNKFINLAMQGPTETPSLESRLGTLSQYPGPHGSATSEPYGRVDALIFNSAYVGYTDGHTPGPRLSTAELQALRTELFQTATVAMNKNPAIEKAYNNNFMKDGLAEIFMQDFNFIYKSGIGTNGAGLDPTLAKGITQFFKFTVFTTKPGYEQKQLMEFIKTQVQDVAQALNSTAPNAEQEFRDKFGMSRHDGAALLGNMLGAMQLGLDAHLSDINKDADAKKEALGFLFDITIGLIPGIGGKLTDEATATAYKLLAQIADKSQSKIIENIKNGALGEARKLFLEANSAKDPKELLENLRSGVNMTLPNGDNGTETFHQTFQSAYSYTVDNK